MLKLFASLVTTTAALMAAIAAMDRGGTIIDQALIVLMSVAIVLCVHLIPAYSRRGLSWAIWTGCLLCATYGHLTFLTHASERAGDIRAKQAPQALAIERQIKLASDALAENKARPVAITATALADSKSWRERAALKVEINEGMRAIKLREDLAKLLESSATTQKSQSNDPVTALLAKATGINENTINLTIWMAFSILLELAGALLWFEVLKLQSHVVTHASHELVTDEISELYQAIHAGHCKPTVASIRAFFGCSQSRASELRRELVGYG